MTTSCLAVVGIAFMLLLLAYVIWLVTEAKLLTGPDKEPEWRDADEIPEDEDKFVITYWSDGDMDVLKYKEFPDFWNGVRVSNAVMLKWAYVDAPGVSDG